MVRPALPQTNTPKKQEARFGTLRHPRHAVSTAGEARWSRTRNSWTGVPEVSGTATAHANDCTNTSRTRASGSCAADRRGPSQLQMGRLKLKTDSAALSWKGKREAWRQCRAGCWRGKRMKLMAQNGGGWMGVTGGVRFKGKCPKRTRQHRHED